MTKAGMYLRNGAIVTTGIMTLDGTRLSFKTAEGVLFDEEVGSLRAEFSHYGTLTIFRGTDKFVFVTGSFAGAFAPQFTQEQIQEISAGENSVTLAVKSKGEAFIFAPNNPDRDIAKLLNGGKGYGLSGLTVAELQRRAFYITLAWVEHLQANGLQASIKGKTYAKSQLTVLLILIPVIAIMSIVAYFIFASVIK
jgi:hypothetical protein